VQPFNTTPKSNLALQLWRDEQIAERAADDQILLDLPELRPRCPGTPFLEVGPRDHASTSTRSLSSSIHLGFLSGTEASEASRGLAAGSSGFKDLASRANRSSAFA